MTFKELLAWLSIRVVYLVLSYDISIRFLLSAMDVRFTLDVLHRLSIVCIEYFNSLYRIF